MKILLSMGEPAGIGPDLCLRIAELDLSKYNADLIIVGSKKILNQRIKLSNSAITLVDSNSHSEDRNQLKCINFENADELPPITPGKPSIEYADWQLRLLKWAIQEVNCGSYSALVTLPIDKWQLSHADKYFNGHTDLIGKQLNSSPLMMLEDNVIRIALATTHIPISHVSQSLNKDMLINKIKILRQGLHSYYNIKNASIMVCGLNPHAGEGGRLGMEEIEQITPAIKQCQDNGWVVDGPYPADSILATRASQNCDAVLSMYHDQLLPVIKTQSFHSTVNVTLGTSIIRTSVDHGTAYNIAGKHDLISSESLLCAIKKAIEIASVPNN